ncbi:hypothetical protein [Xanthomonas phage vB_XooS_NR08]|nr:hypothetical protein [Xanthomonas phage vB_XooS_NR08]
MKIMPLIAAVALCAAFSAAQGSNMAWKTQKASETRSARCEAEVREMAQVFRLRLQVVQPDILSLSTLDRPADQLRRIRAVYSIDMRGTGKETLEQTESLLNLHFNLCMQGA